MEHLTQLVCLMAVFFFRRWPLIEGDDGHALKVDVCPVTSPARIGLIVSEIGK
jgi:hypothetical protein